MPTAAPSPPNPSRHTPRKSVHTCRWTIQRSTPCPVARRRSRRPSSWRAPTRERIRRDGAESGEISVRYEPGSCVPGIRPSRLAVHEAGSYPGTDEHAARPTGYDLGVSPGTVFRRSTPARPTGRRRSARFDDPRRRRPRVPRRGRRGDRRQRGAWPRGDRPGDGGPGRSPRLRPRQRLHHRTRGGVRRRSRPVPAGGRSGDLPGVRWLGGDRNRAQAGPRLPPRERRPGAPDRGRPVGELPRQQPRRARPVGAQAAAAAVRGLARPVPPRLGRLPVPCRAPRLERAGHRRGARRGARPPDQPPRDRTRSPPSSPNRSSGRPSRPSSRPRATGRPSPRSAGPTGSCSSPTR